MGKIFCLIGKSASGKDTVCEQLLLQRKSLKIMTEETKVTFDNGSYVTIQEPEGAKELKRRYGDQNVVVILISVDDGIRLMRALTREMTKVDPHYEEMCDQYLSDVEKFKDAQYDFVCENINVFKCVDEIQEIIRKCRK